MPLSPPSQVSHLTIEPDLRSPLSVRKLQSVKRSSVRGQPRFFCVLMNAFLRTSVFSQVVLFSLRLIVCFVALSSRMAASHPVLILLMFLASQFFSFSGLLLSF